MDKNICPKCGKETFFQNPQGRRCSNCGHVMKVPARPTGTPGPGTTCRNCGKKQVFSGKCRNCGATYN